MVGRYYFNLVEDERIFVDEVGLEFESESDAQSEAHRCAQWIAASYGEGRRPASASVQVQSALGGFCLEVPIDTFTTELRPAKKVCVALELRSSECALSP